MTDPLAYARRTPVRRLLEAGHATWRAIGDTALAETVGEAADGVALGIADLSPLPRLGFKGSGTIEAARRRGIVLEETPNRAFRQPDGGLCLVLSRGEIVLLSNLKGDGDKLAQLESGWSIEDEEQTYPMLRRDSHAWFAIAGTTAPQMLAKLCAIDLRIDHFSNLAIAPTSIAKMSAIVTRADIGTTPTFHLLADSAAALYFCGCLCDAAAEFGGRIVGVGALHDKECA